MGQVRISDDPPIDALLRRSARARRISLRVSGIDGQVTLTLPRGVPEREALDFARSRRGWICKALERSPAPVQVGPGVGLPVEGDMRSIMETPRRSARILPDRIEVPAGRPAGPTVQAALKVLARDRLARAVGRHAAALGRTPGRLTLRDTRSRWGSCTSDGNLMFSWRLILAPPEVLDYVAAHEVAHLVHMDHSPAFWAQVGALMPGYDGPRGWLRREGTGLHRWRFTD